MAGYAFSGGDGANVGIASGIAASGNKNNRQLHTYEARYLAALSEGRTEKEKERLRAAACYLVKCAAGVPKNDPNYGTLNWMQLSGAGYAAELAELSNVELIFKRNNITSLILGDTYKQKLFDYTTLDAADDIAGSKRRYIDPIAGAGSAVIGGVEATGSVVAGAGLCGVGSAASVGTASPLACAGGVTIATLGAKDGYDRAARGTKELIGGITGTTPHVAGQAVLDSFDPNYTGQSRYLGSLAGRFAGDIVGLAVPAAGKKVVHLIDDAASPLIKRIFKQTDFDTPNLNKTKKVNTNNRRPTPKQSEQHVVDQTGGKGQVSYKDGDVVPHSTKGSVRPDCVAGSCAIEVKNYDLSRKGGQSSLIYNTSKQINQRVDHLPKGMTQQVQIDIRGQTVTPTQRDAIIDGIMDKTNGILTPNDIKFID